MGVVWTHLLTEPFNAEYHLHMQLQAVAARQRRFKIGITDNPHRREQEHSSTYPLLLVLYRTSSASEVRNLERALAGKFKDSPWCDNEAAGGGGDLGPDGPYYLYVVYA